jgi:hypothetical protein
MKSLPRSFTIMLSPTPSVPSTRLAILPFFFVSRTRIRRKPADSVCVCGGGEAGTSIPSYPFPCSSSPCPPCLLTSSPHVCRTTAPIWPTNSVQRGAGATDESEQRSQWYESRRRRHAQRTERQETSSFTTCDLASARTLPFHFCHSRRSTLTVRRGPETEMRWAGAGGREGERN